MTTLPKPLKRVRAPKPLRSGKAPKRTKRPNKVRKTTLGKAKRTLWKYFAAYVKARDGKRCFTCDAVAEGTSLHAGHLFVRGIGATLYHPKNCHSQCAGCNRGRRGNVPEYVGRFIARYGEEQFRIMTAKAREMKQWTLPEVLELTEALKKGGADFEILYAERYGV